MLDPPTNAFAPSVDVPYSLIESVAEDGLPVNPPDDVTDLLTPSIHAEIDVPDFRIKNACGLPSAADAT